MAKAKSKKKKNTRKRDRGSTTVAEPKKLDDQKLATAGDGVPMDGGAVVEDDMTFGGKLLLQWKPYWAHILLAILCVMLGSVLWGAFSTSNDSAASQPWSELSNANVQREIAEFTQYNQPSANATPPEQYLLDMGEKNRDNNAGSWAMLMASQLELDKGISMLSGDRKGGIAMIEKAATAVQSVVDAPDSAKSPLAQRRSFLLAARCYEALGKFDQSEKYYREILEKAPESALVGAAQRGLERSTNKEYAAIYEQFTSYEKAAGVAPGPLVPDAPEVKFDIEIPDDAPVTVDPKKAFKIGEEELGEAPGEMKDPVAEGETESEPMEKKVETPMAEKPVEVETPAKPEMPVDPDPPVKGDG